MSVQVDRKKDQDDKDKDNNKEKDKKNDKIFAYDGKTRSILSDSDTVVNG